MKKRALSIFITSLLGTSILASAEHAETLTVWWNKGFYPKQDAAVRQIVDAWEKKTGNTVNLSFYGTGSISTKIVSAITSGNVPDVAYADFNDYLIAPQQAWKGNLLDVSSVVEPMKDKYTEAALANAHLYNNQKHARSYYAVPLKLAGGYNFYWKDLLKDAGYSSADVPKTWDAYWDFFAKVQKKLRADGKRIYGLGLPVAAVGSDSSEVFHQFALNYGAYFVNQDGTLNLTDKTRKGAIDTIKFLKKKYDDGLIPPSAVSWGDADNNAAFFSKRVVMVTNPSLSIPASKADDKKVYNQIVTQGFPETNAGKSVPALVTIKEAIVPKGAKHAELAKDFLSFLIQPKRLDTMLKASRGRFLPVMPKLIEQDPFWSDPKHSHIVTAIKQDVKGDTLPWPYAYNPAYSQVNAEHVWGKAVGDVLTNGVSPKDAVDTAFGKIRKIFSDYKIAPPDKAESTSSK